MNLPLDFHPEVRDEIDESYRWYEQQSPGLGSQFLADIENVVSEITENPTRFGFAAPKIREGILTRFPFAVYYRVLPNRIRILAIHHTSRDPMRWQSRL